MKHHNPSLENLTNADISAANSTDSVIGSVGVITTASGTDALGDLVINPITIVIPAAAEAGTRTFTIPSGGFFVLDPQNEFVNTSSSDVVVTATDVADTVNAGAFITTLAAPDPGDANTQLALATNGNFIAVGGGGGGVMLAGTGPVVSQSGDVAVDTTVTNNAIHYWDATSGSEGWTASQITLAPGTSTQVIVLNGTNTTAATAVVATSTVTITTSTTPTVMVDDTVAFSSNFAIGTPGFGTTPTFSGAATGTVTDVTGNVITITTTPAPQQDRSAEVAVGTATFSRVSDMGIQVAGDGITAGTDAIPNVLGVGADGRLQTANISAGTTINPTDTFLPVRTSATTFGNSLIQHASVGEEGDTQVSVTGAFGMDVVGSLTANTLSTDRAAVSVNTLSGSNIAIFQGQEVRPISRGTAGQVLGLNSTASSIEWVDAGGGRDLTVDSAAIGGTSDIDFSTDTATATGNILAVDFHSTDNSVTATVDTSSVTPPSGSIGDGASGAVIAVTPGTDPTTGGGTSTVGSTTAGVGSIFFFGNGSLSYSPLNPPQESPFTAVSSTVSNGNWTWIANSSQIYRANTVLGTNPASPSTPPLLAWVSRLAKTNSGTTTVFEFPQYLVDFLNSFNLTETITTTTRNRSTNLLTTPQDIVVSVQAGFGGPTTVTISDIRISFDHGDSGGFNNVQVLFGGTDTGNAISSILGGITFGARGSNDESGNNDLFSMPALDGSDYANGVNGLNIVNNASYSIATTQVAAPAQPASVAINGGLNVSSLTVGGSALATGPFYEEGTVSITWQDTTSTPSQTVTYTRIGRIVHIRGIAIFDASAGTSAVSIDDASLPWAPDTSVRTYWGSWSSTANTQSGIVSNFDGANIDISDIKLTGATYQSAGLRFGFTYQAVASTDAIDRRSTATVT